MYENHRDNFGRRHEAERDDRDQRWRRGEDRYRREATGQGGFDQDRYEEPSYRREGFGRDDDYAGHPPYEQGAYGYRPEQSGSRFGRQGQREQPMGRPSYAQARSDYTRPGDSSYFTGQQGSWAVRSPYGSSTYNQAGFGEDYREHGYDRDRSGDQRGFFERAGDEIASWFGDEDATRRREQDHRGRGPKNYVRSDERIQDDANDALTEDWRIDAGDVAVTVENGEVTLDGTVPDRASKRRAEDLVEDISGVKHVQNNLRVAQAGLGEQNRASSDAGGMISSPGSTAQTASVKSNETA